MRPEHIPGTPVRPRSVSIVYLSTAVTVLFQVVDRVCSRICRGHAFPQQLPGPLQPADSPGADPQQVVSFGPGILNRAGPDTLELADITFVRFALLQVLQVTLSDVLYTSTSLISPQSRH